MERVHEWQLKYGDKRKQKYQLVLKKLFHTKHPKTAQRANNKACNIVLSSYWYERDLLIGMKEIFQRKHTQNT